MEIRKKVERAQITAMVISSLHDILAEKGRQPAEPEVETTRLIGRESALDSLGLVNLLVDLEQRIDEHCNCSITLADDRAMSQTNSPFRTIQSLTDYICLLLEEALQHVGS
jgi:acyl carrier protein